MGDLRSWVRISRLSIKMYAEDFSKPFIYYNTIVKRLPTFTTLPGKVKPLLLEIGGCYYNNVEDVCVFSL